MRLDRVMIAAPKSGSGKTMITCALLQAFQNAGKRMVSYKCGPDYIDPMFHQKVLGIPSKNLDTFFTDERETRKLFLKGRSEGEFAILEGVMGLYDGLGGIREEGSSYHLAKVTNTPIILVVDAKGMGRSLIPLIAGFLAYDKEKLIRGVILNRMSKAYYEILAPKIEEELSIRVFGYVPQQKQFSIESRHLGLFMPHEYADMKEQLQAFAGEVEKTVSLEAIAKLAESAEEVADEEKTLPDAVLARPSTLDDKQKENRNRPIIAVARDEAFCFYYEDNLRLLEELGARLEYFSPLHDKELPTGCSGILLGGGYPELHAKELSENRMMRDAIKQAAEQRMPLVAECGGFLYFHTWLEDKEKHSYAMAGVLAGRGYETGKLVRFGYIELEDKIGSFLPQGEKIRGHEFHYFDSEDNGNSVTATKPTTGKQYACVIADEDRWLGFPHLYYPSNPNFAKQFVKKARMYAQTI